jgi:cytidylate kinase
MDVDLARITQEIKDRDHQDSGRSIAPLRKADDALLIDSSLLSIDQVVDRMLSELAKVK